MTSKYTGKIFKITFTFTDLTSTKARPALALCEPDEYGDIEFVFITTKKSRGFGHTLDLPEGLLPFSSIVHVDKSFLLNKQIILKELALTDQTFFEKVLKAVIFKDTLRYYENVHLPQQNKKFVKGKSRIPYAGRVYDEKEMINLVDSSLDFWLTYGRYDCEFCEKLSAYLNTLDMPKVKSITVNSGSSANLLAIDHLG